jgi:RNA polymerase sigma-70 factor (ECF subfamily)
MNMQSGSTQPKAKVLTMPQGDGVSDRALVERALRGDRWAEETIYLRYVGYVNTLCTRLLRTAGDTEDVVQDTFVDVLDQLGSLREPDELRRWITGIAVHKAHRRFRRRRLVALLGLRDGGRDALDSLHARPSLSPDLCAEISRIDRALLQVADEVRACWVLRHVEGHAMKDVAVLCGCSLATAKRRIARAEAVVRAYVQPEEEQDE